ncbi:YhgE/Pip domain-containing protein [Cohnella caldifontis]|uniref:YhgE/Pip domain-containing protein n=1 Tax=Cohnella caldifontis TaxID=3027471 RepID=UPI0023EBB2D1|nr:ABC transporter permease [Cohnella sp. YIM B05605]
MSVFFRQKFVRIAVGAALAVLMIFGLAMMGSVLGAKPKALPVVLAVLDQPADLPGGGQLAVGKMVQEKVEGLAQLPVKWIRADSEEAALAALDRQEAYGALVIPADFSAGVMSLAGPEPKTAKVKLYMNEGMNAQGVSAVRTILQQVAQNVGTELSKQALQMVGQQTEQIPVGKVQALLAPFQVEEASVHAVGSGNGNGSAPVMLTQIAWMGSLIMSVFLFLAGQGARRAGGAWGAAAGQTIAGLALAAGVSGFLVWMAHSWYGMEMADIGAVWLFLWLAAAAFFLMQSALFNWLGIPAVALLVLLLFFSLPILSLAPEFLPQVTQDWLYSWTPFRYVASGLRSLMYFGGDSGMSLPYGVLWGIAGVSLVVLLASALRPDKARVAKTAELAAATVPAKQG